MSPTYTSTRNLEDPPHQCAGLHVTGKTRFMEDLPKFSGQLSVVIKSSPIAKGLINKVNTDQALKINGVRGVLTSSHVTHNSWGPIMADQPILAGTQISFIGEPIAIIIADDLKTAMAARDKITLDLTEEAPILDIDDALKAGSYLCSPLEITRGSPDDTLKQADQRIKGVFTNKGQEHFYFESQGSVAIPQEGDDMIIHCSTQHPSEIQHAIAHALGQHLSTINCIANKMGGAFGGKESQSTPYAILCALAARATGKPCELFLNKDDDMMMTGKRHPQQGHYEVGFLRDGTITALKADIVMDGGAFLDLSGPIIQRSILHVDSAYYIANLFVSGKTVKTNFPPNTAFRGFGGPQGALLMENIIEEVAFHLGKDPLEIRIKNLYGKDERNLTHYGQKVEGNVLPEIVSNLRESTEYDKRRQAILEHNQKGNGPLRGLSMTPVKFGISFTLRFLNQANALIHLHRDGSVQVSTGATEMGQGVFTKIAQVVAECFGIPVQRVKVLPTSTDKNANTSATAASSGSDLNCAAALDAAEKLREPLARFAATYLSMRPEDRPDPFNGESEYHDDPTIDTSKVTFRDSMVSIPDHDSLSFAHLIDLAYMNRMNLSSHGFYKTPDIHYDAAKGKGSPFRYFTMGAACSEVEIDPYTGESKVLRSDLLMDLGRPLNRIIDEGQISGAFLQGMGWLTTEDLRYKRDGTLATHSPTTYKIPSIQDLPRDFRVDFFQSDRTRPNLAVKGSKAVGEPPFLLAFSVFTAIKEATMHHGAHPSKPLMAPATAEEVLSVLEGFDSRS